MNRFIKKNKEVIGLIVFIATSLFGANLYLGDKIEGDQIGRDQYKVNGDINVFNDEIKKPLIDDQRRAALDRIFKNLDPDNKKKVSVIRLPAYNKNTADLEVELFQYLRSNNKEYSSDGTAILNGVVANSIEIYYHESDFAFYLNDIKNNDWIIRFSPEELIEEIEVGVDR